MMVVGLIQGCFALKDERDSQDNSNSLRPVLGSGFKIAVRVTHHLTW